MVWYGKMWERKIWPTWKSTGFYFMFIWRSTDFVRSRPFQQNVYISYAGAIFRKEMCNDKYWVTSRQRNNFTNWKIPICLMSFTYLHGFRKLGLKIQMGFDCSFLHRMNVFKHFFWHADYIIIKKLTCMFWLLQQLFVIASTHIRGKSLKQIFKYHIYFTIAGLNEICHDSVTFE